MQEIEYLGFIIKSRTMTIRLTQAKMEKIQTFCQSISLSNIVSIRDMAKLLGTLTSAFPGVAYGPLHYRPLEREKIYALKLAKETCNACMRLGLEA